MSGRLAEAWGLVLGDLEQRARDAFAEGARLEAAIEALRALGGPGERAPVPVAARPAAAPKALPAPRATAAPEIDAERFRALWRDGASAADICAAFGRKYYQGTDFARKTAAALGLPERGKGWKPGGRAATPTARRDVRARTEPSPAKPDPDARRPGEAEAIAAHIAAKGVTRCPPAVVAASAHLDFKPSAELREHAAAMEAKNAAASDWRGQRDAAARAAGLAKASERGAALAAAADAINGRKARA